MTAQRFRSADPSVDRLYHQLAEWSLQPLWELDGLLTAQPRARAVPYRWPGAVLHELGTGTRNLVSIDSAGDRRVLVCCNPGLEGAPYTVSTLSAALQYLDGHEAAPPHRHTPAALRFVVEGEGVWTLVDGQPLYMSSGDLILTPSWAFHEHCNPTPEAMIWLDVLDLPVVAALDAVFFEPGPPKPLPSTEICDQKSLPRGGGRMESATDRRSSRLVHPWAEIDALLSTQLSVRGGGHARVRYVDPIDGGDVLPTMRCEMQRVLAGRATGTERQTGGRVACVLHGAGSIRVGDETFDIERGDVVAIPSWQAWSIRADVDLDLFSTSDAPVLEGLGLYRCETANGGVDVLQADHR
ncbi:cupin domain-containing protein [Mycobacterium sp. SP-6446]|uniref:cupin domain-containing protein n=1 Tax=Mycobacterium sp. SP-6446 TaxID=1834162 RepID=UPI00096C0662|nr:cupin domain-containing protein [Mycobacterium sp. SP-6446]OMC10577.1 gentisate 1,2-dioxygenase [Mycobacterium sp. SP-6446]